MKQSFDINRSISQLIFYRLPVIGLCALIFWQSSSPSLHSDPWFPHDDKVLHFLCYGVLAVLFFRAIIKETWHDLSLNACIILSILFAFCYGITDEIHQSFVPQRVPSVMDVAADLLGAAAGIGTWVWIQFKIRHPVQ